MKRKDEEAVMRKGFLPRGGDGMWRECYFIPTIWRWHL
jgi:hypothetical protein